MRRNRRSGNSHDLLREFVNSIMNNMLMTGAEENTAASILEVLFLFVLLCFVLCFVVASRRGFASGFGV